MLESSRFSVEIKYRFELLLPLTDNEGVYFPAEHYKSSRWSCASSSEVVAINLSPRMRANGRKGRTSFATVCSCSQRTRRVRMRA